MPNADRATVPEQKVTHYLLNPAHPVGGIEYPRERHQRLAGREAESDREWSCLRCDCPSQRLIGESKP